MDLTTGARRSTGPALPRLVNTPPGHAVGRTSSDTRFLEQLPPPFAEAQPWLPTAYVGEEETGQETYGFQEMYEMPPSDDPELGERRHRNRGAIKNANKKTNREVVKLQGEVAALRAAKEQCQAELTRVYDMARCQQQKTEELKQCLLDTRHQLREKDEYIQSSNNMMSRVKEHLEVIANGLDENNSISRRMLLNLTAQFFYSQGNEW